MKKLFTVLLATALVLPFFLLEGSTAAQAEEAAPVWEKTYYTDVFGDPTDEWYIVNKELFSGTFNNSSVRKAGLSARILVDAENISFVLYEYEKDMVQNTQPTDITYQIRIKAADGEVPGGFGYLNSGSDRIVVDKRSNQFFFDALCGEGTLSFYLECTDQPLYNYLFKAECGNFKDVCYEAAVQCLQDNQLSEALLLIENAQLENYKDMQLQIDAAYETKKTQDYKEAEKLLAAGKYEEAIKAFRTLDQFRDSPERIKEIEATEEAIYSDAESLLLAGDRADAAIMFGKIINYKDSRERCFALWEELTQRNMISGGWIHSVALKQDGTVVAAGNNSYGQCDVGDWNNIVAISAGSYHTVGLKADGTVVAAGNNKYGECEVDTWTDIIAVSAGGSHTVALKTDGTVVAVGKNEHGECNVGDWTEIIAVSAGGAHTAGLKADGTVVAVGFNDSRCDVSAWEDISAMEAGPACTVGLKADGTIVTGGIKAYYSPSNWTDIAEAAAGSDFVLGLKSDGTVIAERGYGSYDEKGQCKVSSWSDIRLPNTLQH